MAVADGVASLESVIEDIQLMSQLTSVGCSPITSCDIVG